MLLAVRSMEAEPSSGGFKKEKIPYIVDRRERMSDDCFPDVHLFRSCPVRPAGVHCIDEIALEEPIAQPR